MAECKTSSTVKVRKAAVVAQPMVGTHAHELKVMREHMKRITDSPEESTAFLKRAGLLTAQGKVKQLVRA